MFLKSFRASSLNIRYEIKVLNLYVISIMRRSHSVMSLFLCYSLENEGLDILNIVSSRFVSCPYFIIVFFLKWKKNVTTNKNHHLYFGVWSMIICVAVRCRWVTAPLTCSRLSVNYSVRDSVSVFLVSCKDLSWPLETDLSLLFTDSIAEIHFTGFELLFIRKLLESKSMFFIVL